MRAQKGFSLVEVIIVVAVIAILGFVGWRFFFATMQPFGENGGSSNDTTQAKSLKAGYKLYEGKGYSLQYPQAWTSNKNSVEKESVAFASNDYAIEGKEGGIANGYLLEVIVSPVQKGISYDADLKYARDMQEAKKGSYETVTVDGTKSVLSDTKSQGAYWDASVYRDDKAYYFRLNAADNKKADAKKQLKDILATVDIK